MAMRYWRVKLQLESALMTPLHSGTLFGQLCWAYRALQGERELVHWLGRQEEEPLLISDAMPRDFLPRPLLAPMGRSGTLSLGEMQDAKRLRKANWVRREDFGMLRRSMTEALLMARLKLCEAESATLLGAARRAHNRIDRMTGTTPKEGGLYFVDEAWPNEATGSGLLDVYVGSSLDESFLRKLFEFVGQWGFGRDASTGRGRWSCRVEPEAEEWFAGEGERRMSLSHGSLTANMEEPRYRLHVHYGKVGGGYGMTSNPFKFPLTLLRPGATFRPQESGPRRWGAMLREVHPEKPWIVHQAEHLTVGYTEGVDG
jgi:CRISPR-associated protein Csm4